MKFEGIAGILLSFLAVSVEGRPVQATSDRSEHLLPIIFVPGKGGSQIEAEVDRTALPDPTLSDCEKRLDRHRMWLNVRNIVMQGVDCWSENARLKFDNVTRKYSDAAGVKTWIPGWGTTDSVEYFDPSWLAWILGNFGVYAKYFVDALVEKAGYERGVSIRAAPYDFRYAPHSQPFWIANLRQLVEDTWNLNGHRKVVLVAHSMGGLYSAHFLSRQTAAWKDRYVEALITVNTPWTGTLLAVEMHVSGYDMEIDALDRVVIRDQQRSFESSVLLLPYATARSRSSSEVVLTTPLRNYTVDDYPELYDAIGHPEGRLKLEAIRAAGYDFLERGMGVPVHCFYSGGTETPERLVYDSMSAFPDSEPRREMGDGDGTVNRRSLEACRHWKHVQPQHPVYEKYHPGIGHRELLHQPRLIDDILDVARGR